MELTQEHENCECKESLKNAGICMPEKCHIIHEDILDLFEFYKQKADKYDKLSNSEKFNKCNDDKEGYCIFENQIDKIQDIILLFDKELEFNMLGMVSIKSVTKRLKDIIQ